MTCVRDDVDLRPRQPRAVLGHGFRSDNRVERAYTAWPDRLYVIGSDGRVAYKSQAGPFGFKTDDVEAALKRIVPKVMAK